MTEMPVVSKSEAGADVLIALPDEQAGEVHHVAVFTRDRTPQPKLPDRLARALRCRHDGRRTDGQSLRKKAKRGYTETL